MTESISKVGLLVSPTFLRKIKAKMISIIPNGAMMEKMAFQPQTSTIQPAKVGPTAGAKAITIPIIPIAEPLLSFGKIKRITVWINGIRIPAPIACKIRPPKSSGKDAAKAANVVPPLKKIMAAIKSWRVVNLLIK